MVGEGPVAFDPQSRDPRSNRSTLGRVNTPTTNHALQDISESTLLARVHRGAPMWNFGEPPNKSGGFLMATSIVAFDPQGRPHKPTAEVIELHFFPKSVVHV